MTPSKRRQKISKSVELEMWANAQRDGRPAALCSTPQSLADDHYSVVAVSETYAKT